MRPRVIARALPLLLALSLVGAAAVPGCSKLANFAPCPEGYTIWMCSVTAFWKSSCTCAPMDVTQPTCATNEAQGRNNVVKYLAMERQYAGATFFTKGCENTGSRFPQDEQPKIQVQDAPTCDATTGDDACVACAKVSCCMDYQACSQDLVCTCWVACKAGGNADALCALVDNCGPLDPVSTAANACLVASCPQCLNMGAMGGDCACGSSTSGATSGAGGSGAGGSPFGGGGSPFGGGAP